MIKLEIDQMVFSNLKALVIMGARMAEAGESGIMAAAQILALLGQALEKSKQAQEELPLAPSKPNGKEARA